MIANACTTLLGIWLVYAAILAPSAVSGPGARIGLLAAAGLIFFALIARATDYAPWHASVVVTLGALLAVEKLVELFAGMPAVAGFWITFWAGILAAIVALWAALYRPSHSELVT